MSIEKMRIVSVAGMLSQLDDALYRCVESGCIHLRHTDTETLDDFIHLSEPNPYSAVLKKMLDINFFGFYEYKAVDCSNFSEITFERLSEYVDKMYSSFKKFDEEWQQLTERLSANYKILTQIKHLKNMRVNISDLINCRHIFVQFGRLPLDSVPKLEYYNDRDFIFVPCDTEDNYQWGVYFTPVESLAETKKCMNMLYFENVDIPDFLVDTPETEISRIQREIADIQRDMTHIEEMAGVIIDKEENMLSLVYCRLKYLYDCFEMRKFALVYKDKFYFTGYVPQRKYKDFEELMEQNEGLTIVSKPPDSTEAEDVPVLIKNGIFSKPFSMFVEMYGLPSYSGINPTGLVAVTYTLLFGIMFGDLGQGIVLSIIGMIINKKTGNRLGAIIQRIGISSAFFGLIFGSVFGYEEALNPLYKLIGLQHKPIEVMESTNFILAGAICIGVLMIIISIGINTVVNFRKQKLGDAIFGNNGLAGLLFFIALLWGIVGTMLLDIKVFTVPYVIILIVMPLLIMFFREPLGCFANGEEFHLESGIGDFIASNFFEVFEFLLGYATNTLSFVRIGGFIFSHAGMMSVVMLLAETVGNGASIIVVILGNIFVMGMEGMIVGIQVLRLEFYEIFSRFYDGTGCPFKPVQINYSTEVE